MIDFPINFSSEPDPAMPRKLPPREGANAEPKLRNINQTDTDSYNAKQALEKLLSSQVSSVPQMAAIEYLGENWDALKAASSQDLVQTIGALFPGLQNQSTVEDLLKSPLLNENSGSSTTSTSPIVPASSTTTTVPIQQTGNTTTNPSTTTTTSPTVPASSSTTTTTSPTVPASSGTTTTTSPTVPSNSGTTTTTSPTVPSNSGTTTTTTLDTEIIKDVSIEGSGAVRNIILNGVPLANIKFVSNSNDKEGEKVLIDQLQSLLQSSWGNKLKTLDKHLAKLGQTFVIGGFAAEDIGAGGGTIDQQMVQGSGAFNTEDLSFLLNSEVMSGLGGGSHPGLMINLTQLKANQLAIDIAFGNELDERMMPFQIAGALQGLDSSTSPDQALYTGEQLMAMAQTQAMTLAIDGFIDDLMNSGGMGGFGYMPSYARDKQLQETLAKLLSQNPKQVSQAINGAYQQLLPEYSRTGSSGIGSGLSQIEKDALCNALKEKFNSLYGAGDKIAFKWTDSNQLEFITT